MTKFYTFHIKILYFQVQNFFYAGIEVSTKQWKKILLFLHYFWSKNEHKNENETGLW